MASTRLRHIEWRCHKGFLTTGVTLSLLIGLTMHAWAHGELFHFQRTQPGAETFTLPSTPDTQTATIGATQLQGPELVGQWHPPMAWPVIAVHAAMLPSGRVLHYVYPSLTSKLEAVLWHPSVGNFEPATINVDVFCSGLSFLADGSLFVSGGNDYQCDTQGRRVTHLFDSKTQQWTRLQDMSEARWYPANLTLGDGRVLILSGLGQNCRLNSMMEIYTPGLGLQEIPEGRLSLDLYPRVHVLSTGKVAHVGPEDVTRTFDPATRQWQVVTRSLLGWRHEGTSVLVPGTTDEIMTIGGFSEPGRLPNRQPERIDFNAVSPTWRPTGQLNIPRAHANAVILPDRKVLLVGGGQFEFYLRPIHQAEMYDPDTEMWTLLPAQHYARAYHSTAILLPDGRVLSAGQDYEAGAFTAEIYDPPYLFRGPRPVITNAPERLIYGEPFSIVTAQASAIGSVALIALSAATHSVNTAQRYVGLDFAVQAANSVTATAPAHGNLAPPGPYMLFILNAAGVPSEAKILLLGAI